MTRRMFGAGLGIGVLGLFLLTAACGHAETGGGGIAGGSVPAAGSRQGGMAIDFRSEPDPPKSGQNALQVDLKQPDGSPVTDANVKVVFSMPAMPSMNMPAMRSETTLTHDSAGRYRGTGDLSMAGTWNVAVTVSRGGAEVGTRNLSIVAK